jgi:hypothetical protein
VHEFAEAGLNPTRMTDRVFTSVPRALLRPVFGYRYRQLAGDLAAHRWARQMRNGAMTVAITGSSGLVGSALAALLTSGGDTVIRGWSAGRPRSLGERRWDPENPDPGLLHGVGAVVHLAGAPIAGRFTPVHKHAIRASRTTPTRKLAELAAATSGGPWVLVTASAIGYYGPGRDDELLTEDSARGEGFLADVVAERKQPATRPATPVSGSRSSAPASCRARAAGPCGCSGHWPRWARPGGSAQDGSGCHGSGSTTWPTSTTVR